MRTYLVRKSQSALKLVEDVLAHFFQQYFVMTFADLFYPSDCEKENYSFRVT